MKGLIRPSEQSIIWLQGVRGQADCVCVCECKGDCKIGMAGGHGSTLKCWEHRNNKGRRWRGGLSKEIELNVFPVMVMTESAATSYPEIGGSPLWHQGNPFPTLWKRRATNGLVWRELLKRLWYYFKRKSIFVCVCVWVGGFNVIKHHPPHTHRCYFSSWNWNQIEGRNENV